MRKEKLEFLESIANYLPGITEKRTEIMWMWGYELITKNIFTDNSGLPIALTKRYTTRSVTTENVNHLEKLIATYKSGGLPAVDQYTKTVSIIYTKQRTETTGVPVIDPQLKEFARKLEVLAELATERTFNIVYLRLLFAAWRHFVNNRFKQFLRSRFFNKGGANTGRFRTAGICHMK
ncbi:MAG: hypothetical protein V4717_11165 [Bacteroidota bacterium]